MIIMTHSVKNFQMVKNGVTALLSIQDISGTIRAAAHFFRINLYMVYISQMAMNQ